MPTSYHPCEACAARDIDDYASILTTLRRLGMHLEAQQMLRELHSQFPEDARFQDHQYEEISA
jgi:hypothetical protein